MDVINLQPAASNTADRFFPHKTARPYQREAVEKIMEKFGEGCKYVFLEAPTGFGKSAVAVALANHYKNAYILVSSKLLQAQYQRDFSLKTVIGRNNFKCLLDEGRTVDIGDCVTKKGFECSHLPSGNGEDGYEKVARSASRGPLFVLEGKELCHYWRQKCGAMNARMAAFNYDYFLAEANGVGDFGGAELVVCDEAHNIEAKLMDFVGFGITDNVLDAIGQRVPSELMGVAGWIRMLAGWLEGFEIFIEKHSRRAEKLDRKGLEELAAAKERVRKLHFIIRELVTNPSGWIADQKEGSVAFRPIEVSRFGGLLFRNGERFVLQSATILDHETMASSLGLKEKAAMIRVPSTFDPERRLIHFQPAGSMSKNSYQSSLDAVVERVKDILNDHRAEKGVIHTHSYRLCMEMASALDGKRVITHGPAGREAAFEEFLTSGSPKVLVTPSAYEGVDFKYDFCRFQVICKVPYPHLGDPQIKARMELDPRWYSWMTAVRLVQTYGRGMRSHDDYCTTYLLDSDFIRFFRESSLLLPAWFREALRQEVY